ncbi:MAG TPA: hypothetical protein VN622_02790 [Clostridia bacterium]|nr:hypothetical protein [Clostridia bacterium]
MKLISSILILAFATAGAFAQTAAPAAKPAASVPGSKSAPPPLFKPKPAPQAKAAAAPVAVPKKPGGAAKPARKVKQPASAEAPAVSAAAMAAKAPARKGKRDPFVSPVVSRIGGPTNCPTGKKCLVVDQVRLQGVVRAQAGMIAMVINAANKTYFLREKDPVFNGFVMKITPDSIVFRETTHDRLGNPTTREVVKRVNTPAV